MRFFAEPVAELTHRTAREGSESVQPAQLGKMFVPGLGPHRVVGEFVPVQVERSTLSPTAGMAVSFEGGQDGATTLVEFGQLKGGGMRINGINRVIGCLTADR